MKQDNRRPVRISAALILAAVALAASLALPASAAETMNPAPTEKDWLAIARLPDWSGVWTPDVTDQFAKVEGDPAPWNPSVAADIAHMKAEEKAAGPSPC